MTTPVTSFQRIGEASPLSAEARESILELFAQEPAGQPVEYTGLTALYARLSQDDGTEGESNSISNQKKILERYCRDHGYTNIRHYEDDGYTGTNFNRPGFQKMLADIKAGRIVRVIVKDMSRFGRDYLQVGMYTAVLFQELGVHFIAVNDGVDSTRGDNEFTAIRNIFNEMYARDTSKKIRATWKSKGNAGEHLCTNPPYGYRKSPEDEKKWIIDEEAAAVVQKVFSLCIGGLGPTQIAKWLHENRVLCPAAYAVSKGKKPTTKPPQDVYRWNNEAVSRMLSRIEYLGHTVNFKTCKKSYKSKKKLWTDPSEWAVFENTQEPIIEESVFMAVQNIRKERKRPTRMGEMGMFSGLLYCMDCGGRMYLCRANHFEKRQEYYLCSTYRKDRALCSTHTIRHVILEEIVLRNLREAIQYVSRYENDFIQEAAEFETREQSHMLAKKQDMLEQAEKRRAELDTIFRRLYEDNVMGKLTDERFLKLSREYEREQEELKMQSETLCKDIQQGEKQKVNVKNFIAMVKKYTDLKQVDATILREFIHKIYISACDRTSDTREIHIVYNFIGPFDFDKAIEQAKRKSA